MDEFTERDDTRLVVKNKLRQYFDGRIVRKDLTKRIKEGGERSGLCAGVPAGAVLQFR